MANANSKAAPAAPVSTERRSGKPAATTPGWDPAGLATSYFNALIKDPGSVELCGFLDDAKRNDGGTKDEGLDAFGDRLQEHFVTLLAQRPEAAAATAPSRESIDLLAEIEEQLETIETCCDSISTGAANHLQTEPIGGLIENAAKRAEEIAERARANVEGLRQVLKGGAA